MLRPKFWAACERMVLQQTCTMHSTTTFVTCPTDVFHRSRNSNACCRRVRPCMSITERVKRRAQHDMALLQQIGADSARAFAAACAATALFSASFVAPAIADIPEVAPAAALYDEAGVVQKGNENLFAKAMDIIERNTGYKVRFIMAKTLPYGETPDEYAQELFSQWSLGSDDVLFVASPKLARAGAFVGENAASRLSHSIAESICNETYAFKAGDESYGAALLDISNRLIPVLNGKEDPGPPDLSAKEVVQTYKTKSETSKDRTKYIVVVSAVLVIAFVAPLVQTYWYVKDD